MERGSLKSHDVVRLLAAEHRVVVLGGIAVVLHGLHRTTKDVHIWIDPQKNANLWGVSLKNFLKSNALTAAMVSDDIGNFVSIPLDEIGSVAAEQRFVRILGADRPIDAFRISSHLDADEFDEIWERSEPLQDGARLMSEIDLIVTKIDTGRPHDDADMRFLQTKVETAYRQRLLKCSFAEAVELFERFPTADLAAFAAVNAEDRSVRDLGLRTLDDLANEGDFYATELSNEIKFRHRGRGDD